MGNQLGRHDFGFLGRSESSRTLLIHFGPRSDAVDGQVQDFAGTHEFVESVDVQENLFEHGRLVENDNLAFDIAVCTRMNDAVHVQIKVVYLQVLTDAFFELAIQNVGVLVGQPTKHFGNAIQRC